ncbi:metallophosphoesterase family protein [Sphingomonas sp. BK235]|jgi:serine/threonine protein phosphatase 1|uniref:metallophosphoesterase family protein n=1 Tax=Sphingomonas sp. BK235 TaxID=2512131 RepID=UPI0010460501|nr:metallophosphoesterase family protein [Sphingomonas sp. BK235]TCP31898.1 serine/threonine protein phosphatase 1 [Sphingomonas sp. BK235]
MSGADPGDAVERVYAIGDLHGRLDLFRALMRAIERDHAARAPVTTRIVLLGDIVDRGPDSATLVQGCMRLSQRNPRFTVLRGNHEEMMVHALRGDLWAYRAWLDFGGRETLLSWGAPPELVADLPQMPALRAAARIVGREVIDWLARLPLWLRHADHLFVHAGLRPGVALDRQTPRDLLWIGEEFLDAAEDHGMTVVHGHTIHEGGPDVRANRIGIDTGAYRTGRLTAMGLERGARWFLDTGALDAREAAGAGAAARRAAS